jgi:hypothetical protein
VADEKVYLCFMDFYITGGMRVTVPEESGGYGGYTLPGLGNEIARPV